MSRIKIFSEFNEANTEGYAPPKFVIKPYPGDTGFALVRKGYNRFAWTVPSLGKKGKIDKGDKVKESMYIEKDPSSPSEISGMGNPADFDGKAIGYMNRSGYTPFTDQVVDPDVKKKKKLKTIKDFEDFILNKDEEK